MRSLALVLAMAVGASALVIAQEATRPPVPRDSISSALLGPSAVRLSGRVVAGDTKQPVRRVTISLTSGNLPTARWTSTDDDGMWAFANVAPGAYTVTASRDGYVTTAYGQKGAYGRPATVAVAAGEARERLDITLRRGGVITAGYWMMWVSPLAERESRCSAWRSSAVSGN